MGPLLGHGAGRGDGPALEARGVPVRRVFLGAQLLGDADRRRAAIAELAGLTDTDIAARLAADGGYTALGELDAQRAAQVGAAYRHDCVSAHRYFLGALDNPTAPKLAAPVTVVVAADDPSTADFAQRHREWRLLADRSTCTSSPTAATTSCAPDRRRRREAVLHAPPELRADSVRLSHRPDRSKGHLHVVLRLRLPVPGAPGAPQAAAATGRGRR